MHNHWLLQTDPDTYSFDNLLEAKRVTWKQVKNHIGLKELRNIKKGDLIMIYHNGNERCIIGIAEAVSEPYKDPDSDDIKAMVIDLKPIKKLTHQVPLWQIRNNKILKNIDLFNIPELFVSSLSEGEWDEILVLAKEKIASL
jgi:predicted RNA-binding protein with PUA-like domain